MDASRFDTLTRLLAGELPRRRVLGLLAGLGLGGSLLRPATRPTAARTVDCPVKTCPEGQCNVCIVEPNRCSCWCGSCVGGGIAGGGMVRTAHGEAHLALLATRTAAPNQRDAFAVQGQVRWADPAWEGGGLTLESTTIAFYGPLPDVAGGREVVGWLRADRAPGEHPFVLRAVDAGPPGSGRDTVALWVGDAVREDPAVADTLDPAPEPSGFRYAAAGVLLAGDLQLISLASIAEAGESATGTPTP